MIQVMFDLETWGTRPGCAIRSVGAVAFRLDGGLTQAEYYANIDTHSCLYRDLRIERGTHDYWRGQSEEARAPLLVNQRPLEEVLAAFHTWYRQTGATAIWSQGSNFDEPIWAAAAHACGLVLPWKYYQTRDTRTLYGIAGLDPRDVAREGVHHHALDDARHQVRCAQAAWRKLFPLGGGSHRTKSLEPGQDKSEPIDQPT